MTGSRPPSPGKPSNVGVVSANAIIHDDDRSTVAKTRPRPVAKSGRKTGLVFALAGATAVFAAMAGVIIWLVSARGSRTAQDSPMMVNSSVADSRNSAHRGPTANVARKPDLPKLNASRSPAVTELRSDPASLELLAGGAWTPIDVAFERTETGPITIDLAAPAGVEVNPAFVVVDANEPVRFELRAMPNASSTHATVARLSVRGTNIRRMIPVTVKRLDFQASLASSGEIILSAGQEKTIEISIDRSGGYSGALNLTIPENAIVKAAAVQIPANANTATVPLTAQPNARSGGFTVRITVAAADGTASREVAVLVRFPPMVEVRTFAGHTGIVHAVSLSADGKFAISGGSDGTVRLWNVATGAEIWKGEGHSGAVLSVAFSADGSQAVSGGVDKTVRVWETATGTSRTFSITAKPDAGHASAVWLVRFDDPKHVHSVSADKSIHWVAATGKPRQVPAGRPDLILGQKYKPDIANGEEIKPTTRVPTDSGEFLASGIGLQVATVWKRGATEKAAPRSIGHTPAMATPAKLFAISSDGSRLLTVGENNGIQLWDVGGTGTAARTAKAVAGFPWAMEDEVTCVALDVDGKQALLGGRNGALKLWGLTSNNPAPSRTAARLTDDRSFWRFGPQIGSGYFRLMPDGKWEERGKGDGRPIGVWEEIGRTPEYVELYDPKRNRKTRLGAGKAWMTTGRDSTRFRPSPAGNWEKADANSGA